MAIEVEKLIFAAEAETKQFERDMARIPQVVEEVGRKAQAKAAKFAKANEQVQRSFADAGIREQRRLTNEVLREIEKRNKAASKFSHGSFSSSFGGNLAANAVGNASGQVNQFVEDAVKMNASLDRLVRFTSTLDKSFNNAIAIKAFTKDIKNLSTEIPFTAEKIAEASFSIKSAFSNLDRPQTVEFLRQFGLAATASNADIADFTKNTVALAKVFKVEMKDLPSFMAKVNATFKDGLAADSDVAKGFQQTTTSITNLKLSLTDYLAIMSTVQSTTADAAEATTNIRGLFDKLADGNVIEKLKEVFNIDRFKADGSLKEVNQIINEIAQSLKGLPDDQRIAKIFSTFGDRQARDGLLVLLGNLDTYNNKLKDASGAEAFKNTTDTMMNAVESRWTRMMNNIKNDQSGFGGAITEFFLSAFDSTTVMGGITIFFNNIGGAILQGILGTVQIFDSVVQSISQSILGLFFDDATIEKYRLKSTEALNSIAKSITAQTEKNNQIILQNQKNSWQKMADATADPEIKAQMLKKVESLQKSISSSVNNAGADLYQSYKDMMMNAIKGIISSDEEANKHGAEAAQSLVDSINKVLANPNLDPAIAKEFRALLDELKRTAEQYGVTLQNISFRTGANIGLGLIAGMRSQKREVMAMSASLGRSAIISAKTELQEASPSKVFVEIGKNIVAGLIIGLDDNSPKVAKSIEKMTREAIGSAYESLGQIYADYQAMRNPEMLAITAKTIDADETKRNLQELIELRIRLGANTNLPLPKSADIMGELVALRKYNDELRDLAELSKAIKNEKGAGETYFEQMKKLDEMSVGKGFFKLAEEAGLTLEQFKQAIATGAMAHYLDAITKIDSELSDSNITNSMKERAEAMEKISSTFESIYDEKKQQDFANSLILNPNKVNLPVDNEEPPQLKKTKEEFTGLADFLDRTFTDLRQGGWRGMLDGMLLDLSDTLQQMFVKLITSQIYKALNMPQGETSTGGGFWSKLLGIGISALASGLSSGISGSFSKALNYAPTLTTPGGTVGMPIMRAKGGDVRAGMPHIVGEDGWEMFVPRQSGTILNQKQLGYTLAPDYNFANNSQGNSNSANSNGGNSAPIIQNFNFYPDPQTGSFSKASAQQATKRMIDAQKREAGRR